ncbi:type II secretion system secretin GspD [Gilvimarinus polysaccharolyticus]|uniref:type II secretion system secretin GspD n=1 Tax=Gilvimarinus polysaccharolyticus TaxID=863921 RepID=UPI000673449F|nr:type II secretion system secretin GspD [Gilvimarinus polysaccharolyticus]
MLTSCAQWQVDDTPHTAESAQELQDTLDSNNSKPEVFGAVESAVDNKPSDSPVSVYQGTGKTIDMPKRTAVVELDGKGVTLNFASTPLEDVVHGILGDILAQEYVVEGEIPGVVTLRTQAPVARQELLIILESMLDANGAALVKRADGRYLVTASKDFKAANPLFQNSASLQPGYSNVIIPLQYIGAAQMAEILQPVAPESAFVRIDTIRNLLILGGGSTQLNGWLDIIQTFDVNYLAGMSVGVFPIEFTSLEEVEAALATLMATSGDEKSSPLSGLIRTVPLESLSAVMVVTPRKELLSQVQTWIERLDRAPTQSTEPQLFVYSVQNGDADHLAQLISNVFGGSGGGSSSSNRGNSGVAPGLTSSNLSSGDNSSTTSSNSQRSSGSSRSGASSYSLADDLRIVADEVNNTLLIYAKGAEYRKIERALKQLDVMPSQILIEASILEVSLTGELSYGLEWYFDNVLGGGWTGDGYVGLGVDSEGGTPAFGYAFSNPLEQVQALLKAESTKSLVKVLSTPSIMVLDNHSASIHVGTQQPIRSSSTLLEGGGVSNSISYRDTGVKLDVTPSVNAGGLVTMDLLQSVTDIGSVDEGTGQASFYERNIESRVAVRSGEAVVLGGLISDNETEGKTGLPFFQDLPIIGSLFGSNTSNERRTELLVIITPHVMKTDQDIRDVTKEMRRRMKGLEAFQRSLDSSKLVDPNF